MERLSSYAKSLTAASKERYKEKICLIGGLDLFLKDETSLSLPERLKQSLLHRAPLFLVHQLVMCACAYNLVISLSHDLGQTNLIFCVTDFFLCRVTRQGGRKKRKITSDLWFIVAKH